MEVASPDAMKGRHCETANRRAGTTFSHQRGSSYNICQPLRSRGWMGPLGGWGEQSAGPGSGTRGPDPSQSPASAAELWVSAEGGRLGARGAPAWLRWRSRGAGPTPQALLRVCRAASRRSKP